MYFLAPELPDILACAVLVNKSIMLNCFESLGHIGTINGVNIFCSFVATEARYEGFFIFKHIFVSFLLQSLLKYYSAIVGDNVVVLLGFPKAILRKAKHYY